MKTEVDRTKSCVKCGVGTLRLLQYVRTCDERGECLRVYCNECGFSEYVPCVDAEAAT